MKKSTFIDYTVILAVLSNRKKRRREKARLRMSAVMENVNSLPTQHPAAA